MTMLISSSPTNLKPLGRLASRSSSNESSYSIDGSSIDYEANGSSSDSFTPQSPTPSSPRRRQIPRRKSLTGFFTSNNTTESNDNAPQTPTTPSSPRRTLRLFVRRKSLNNKPSKTVRFQDKDNLTTVIAAAPTAPMTSQECHQAFWTKAEIKSFAQRALNTLRMDWHKRESLAACLYLCYGLVATDITPHKDYRDLTPETALNFFYAYKVAEPQEQEDQQDSPLIRTGMRGLEHQLCGEIEDYRADHVQRVLNLQQSFWDHDNNGSHSSGNWSIGSSRNSSTNDNDDDNIPKENKKMVTALFKRSVDSSRRARRFARLLGKADAAVLGMSTSPPTDEGN